MFTRNLLPYRFQRIGWVLFIGTLVCVLPLAAAGRCNLPWQWLRHATHALTIAGLCGLALIVLSREKHEDEYLAALCGQTLIAVASGFFLLTILWVGAESLHAARWLGLSPRENRFFFTLLPLQLTNIWVVLPVYVLVFKLRLWRLRKEAKHEE